ncbi:hypothetical protein JNW91_14840 [Micromonospora sp. STR1_7]|uniref:Uncharacterized protein n=1 Tax=Micromonospora parastrephiae TaxID=2806101 RepID=A0ABS1XUS3_9ACTN|nr:hypothetical protein [Micromonospora parastrephiae]MBM0233025.1 hypothetical protein [Micromonospora parastrephiae]
MPARRNPKKSRTPRATPPRPGPAANHGPLLSSRPDLDLAVEPIEPALPAVLVEPAEPAVLAEPVVPAAVPGELAPSIDVPPAFDAPVIAELPKAQGRSTAPTAGPLQGGGGRAGGGRSQQAGQTRRYAFRRS